MRVHKWLDSEWVQILLITGLAATLRLVALTRLPPGLYHDEAFNGLDALQVLQGSFPIFFEANNGREPLFIYLVAVAVRLLGRTPLALRSVASLLGILTVPAGFLMAREWLSRRVAVLTAIITCGTFWHLNLSRIGFRAVGLPLFLALWLWQCGLGLHRSRRRHWMLAGFFLGLGGYTYIAARFVPVALVLWIAYWALRRQPIPWAGLFLMGLSALVVSAPLLAYAARNLDLILSRSSQVSIFSDSINGGDLWGALTRNVLGTLGMFNWRGDFIPRHNLPYRPVFDPLMGLMLLLGLGVCVRTIRRRQEPALLLAVALTMLLPTLLAEGAPHMLRAVGVLPVLFVFPAIGLNALGEWIAARRSPGWAVALVALALVSSCLITTYDYFVRHAPSEDVYYNFEAGAAELAVDINDFLSADSAGDSDSGTGQPNGDRLVLLEERLWNDWASLRLLIPESAGLVLINDSTLLGRGDNTAVRLVVWPFEDFSRYLALLPTDRLISVREGPLERGDLEDKARRLCLTFEAVSAKARPDNLRVPLEHGITLLGAEVERTERQVWVRLLWQASQALTTDYSVFVHLKAGNQPLAQSDSYPAQGYYRTGLWRPGDTVVDEHILTAVLPEDRPLVLNVGMYSLQTMTRLQVLDATGAPGADHVVIPLP